MNKLKIRQGLPLEAKIILTKQRIKQWYEHWNGDVYISFSGGKDSTVLLHLVRSMYPHVPAVFVDTGLEYPEIRDFVKTIDNVVWLKPKMPFTQVIEKYGYPVVSKKVSRQLHDIKNATEKNQNTVHLYMTGEKQDGTKSKYFKLPNKWKILIHAPFNISHKCCDVMKKKPIKEYEKETGRKGYIGTMAADSEQRKASYIKTGCNSYSSGRAISRPIGFWLEDDIWEYIKKYNIPYSKIYDMGENRTGCMFCMFGVHLEKGKNRFQRMAKTHPKQYKYCIEKLGCGKVLDAIGASYTHDPSLFDQEA